MTPVERDAFSLKRLLGLSPTRAKVISASVAAKAVGVMRQASSELNAGQYDNDA
jgi:hypothetical protein